MTCWRPSAPAERGWSIGGYDPKLGREVAIKLARGRFAEDRLSRAHAEITLGEVLHRRGRETEAMEHLEIAQTMQGEAGAPAHERAKLMLSIARVRVASGEPKERMRPQIEDALAEVRAMAEVDEALVERLEQWLRPPEPTPERKAAVE